MPSLIYDTKNTLTLASRYISNILNNFLDENIIIIIKFIYFLFINIVLSIFITPLYNANYYLLVILSWIFLGIMSFKTFSSLGSNS